HPSLAIFFVDALYLIFYYILIVKIGTMITDKKNINTFRLSVLTSLVLVSFNHLQQEVFLPVFNSHFGSCILVYLFGSYLILKLFKQKSVIYSSLLAIFCVATSHSDPY